MTDLDHPAEAWAGRRVLVLGLGVTGVAVAEVLAANGAAVFASDSGDLSPSDAEALAAAGIEVEFGGHTKARAELDTFDFVVPSPGISPLRGFLADVIANGKTVVSELELGAAMTDATVVAVTGTNGKTTVCRLLERIGRAAGRDAYACGNLETKFISAAAEHQDADMFVVEASSFALAFCEDFHPKVSIITSLAPDHLDWHGTFAHYRESKARIAAHQTPDDLFLYPREQPELASLAPDRGPKREAFSRDDFDDEAFARFAERGPHFADDAAAAAKAASFLGISHEAVVAAMGDFGFDEHRLAPVGTKDGVRVIDDSVSANPLATVAALRAFDDPIVLIAGGRNKGLDLGPMAGEASRLRGVVAMGEAAPELVATFAQTTVPTKTVTSMGEAVSMALGMASPGDVVLLSPGCASWDMFNGYADRGRAFLEACRDAGVTGGVTA